MAERDDCLDGYVLPLAWVAARVTRVEALWAVLQAGPH